MLDLAGLDYDAVDRRLSLRPVLPGSWPQTGHQAVVPLRRRSPTCSSGRSAAGSITSSSRRDSNTRSSSTSTSPARISRSWAPGRPRRPCPSPSFDPRTGQIAWSMTLARRSRRMELDLGLSRPSPRRSPNPGHPDRRPSGAQRGGSRKNASYRRCASPSGEGSAIHIPRIRPRSTTPFSRSCPKSP